MGRSSKDWKSIPTDVLIKLINKKIDSCIKSIHINYSISSYNYILKFKCILFGNGREYKGIIECSRKGIYTFDKAEEKINKTINAIVNLIKIQEKIVQENKRLRKTKRSVFWEV